MKDLSVALCIIGVVGFCCWGLVSCEEIITKRDANLLKFYVDNGFKQSKWGGWYKP